MNTRFMSRFMGAACFMSATGAENSSTAVPEAAENAGAVELFEKYAKKGKVVVLTGDELEDFLGFSEMIGEANYTDWTKKVDTKVFPGLAMVKTESGVNRLIPIASKEAALADAVVAAALYRMYVNRVVNAAGDNDAQEVQFVTEAGNFKQKFDLEAFKFQQKVLVKFLRTQGLTGVTNSGLRLAFASHAFANTQFPRIDAEAWDKIIGIAEKNAAANGFDTAIFDYWKQTRSVKTADTSTLKLDFEALQAAEDALGETEDAPETAASVTQ